MQNCCFLGLNGIFFTALSVLRQSDQRNANASKPDFSEYCYKRSGNRAKQCKGRPGL
jgi:hypothetical protein